LAAVAHEDRVGTIAVALRHEADNASILLRKDSDKRRV